MYSRWSHIQWLLFWNYHWIKSVTWMGPTPNLVSTWYLYWTSTLMGPHGTLIWFLLHWPTLIWIISDVCSQMAYKITFLCESLVTINTLVWFIPGMWPPNVLKGNYYLRKTGHIGMILVILIQCASSCGF